MRAAICIALGFCFVSTQGQERAAPERPHSLPTAQAAGEHPAAKESFNVCGCVPPKKQVGEGETEKSGRKIYSETVPYNSFPLAAVKPGGEADKFNIENDDKSRGVIALETNKDLEACLEPGDVIVHFRPYNDHASANNLQNAIQKGTTHAAMVFKDDRGKFYHMDSPQGYGGEYQFAGPFHILRLRKDKQKFGMRQGRQTRAEVLAALQKNANSIRGKYQYDGSLSTDVYQEGLKTAANVDSIEDILRKGCEQMCTTIESGRCPPQYCSELVYTLYSVSGVEGLKPEGLAEVASRLETEIFAKMNPAEREIARQRFVDSFLGDPAVRQVLGANVDTTRTLMQTLLSSTTPASVRRAVDRIRGPVFFPHNFMDSARDAQGDFCYAGTYFGGAFSNQGLAQRAETQNSENLLLQLQGHTEAVTSAAFSPDGNKVLTTSNDHTVKLWDAATGRLLNTFSERGQAYFSAAIGSSIVVGTQRGALFYDANTGRNWGGYAGHTGAVLTVEFSPDESNVLSASHDHTARLWNFGSKKAISTDEAHSASVFEARFSPDGSKFFTASGDGTVGIWETSTGKLIRKLTNPVSKGVYRARFSPDSSKIVTGSLNANVAHLWDVAEGKLLQTLASRTAPDVIARRAGDVSVSAIQFSPDGSRVLTVSDDGNAHLWGVASGQEMHLIPEVGRTAIFSPDGSKILTGGWTPKVWDANTYRPLRDLTGHEGSTYDVEFSSDGSKIVTASADRGARIFATESLRDLAERHLRDLYEPTPGTVRTPVQVATLIENRESREAIYWDNLLLALKENAHYSRDQVHGIINARINSVEVQNLLKTRADRVFGVAEAR